MKVQSSDMGQEHLLKMPHIHFSLKNSQEIKNPAFKVPLQITTIKEGEEFFIHHFTCINYTIERVQVCKEVEQKARVGILRLSPSKTREGVC